MSVTIFKIITTRPNTNVPFFPEYIESATVDSDPVAFSYKSIMQAETDAHSTADLNLLSVEISPDGLQRIAKYQVGNSSIFPRTEAEYNNGSLSFGVDFRTYTAGALSNSAEYTNFFNFRKDYTIANNFTVTYTVE